MPNRDQSRALPGDIVQIIEKRSRHFMAFMVVENSSRQFLAARFPRLDVDSPNEEGGAIEWDYCRLRHTEYAIVGTAALVSGEIGRARALALETGRQVAKERGQ